MKMPFNLEEQNLLLENRILVGFERISEVFRILLWDIGKKYGLSPIQIQILIFVATHNKEKSTVSYLAKEFNLTKATISDAVHSLLTKELLRKTGVQKDKRSFSLELTSFGEKVCNEISVYPSKLLEAIGALSLNEKEALLFSLMKLIHRLVCVGVIQIQRMCFTCQFYEVRNGKHYCNFLKEYLKTQSLRLDCPDHIERHLSQKA